jgi:N-acetyl-gamma-glutamyl-phosphate reductase
MIRAAIVGIKGYAGEELLSILAGHQAVTIEKVTARVDAGAIPLKEIYPQMARLELMCENLDVDSISRKADVVFFAVPHKVSMEIVPKFLEKRIKVIDLSADFRLNNSSEYEKWYNEKHKAEPLLKKAVYGLPELYKKKLSGASLVANPGCYPTAAILALAPALKKKVIKTSSIIIDSKSGISGAGRKNAEEYFKIEHPNARAYNIAGHHRHIPEIEQELSKIAAKKIIVTFTPHIIPVERGMLATVYADLLKKVSSKDILKMYKDFYKNEPFVRVLEEGKLPSIKNVVKTNFCEIGLEVDVRAKRLIVVSAIDNLVKGASGQAVQNMNIMFGFDETMGLT